MTELEEGQFELDGYTFGGASDFVVVQNLELGDRSLEVQDTRLGLRGNLAMGRDIEVAPEWTFDLAINSDPGHPAFITIGQLRRAWKGPIHEPGKLSILRYNLGGHVRRVYGRPRRFTELDVKGALNNGVAYVLTTFQLADPHIYEDWENGVRINIVPATGGGFMAPLRAPIRTTHSGGPRANRAYNAGHDETPLTVKIHGPISQPWVAGPGWRVELNLSLAYDRYVTIDARAMTVLRDDGASVAGALTRQSRLADMYLPSGYHDLTFGGADPTGTAYCEVRWHDAWLSL